MRYRDAVHVQVGPFYARRPEIGKPYRLFGYAGAALAVLNAESPERIAVLLGVLILAWLVAWYRVVGTLWRSSLVAAIVICAVILSAQKCQTVHAPVGLTAMRDAVLAKATFAW